MASDQVWTVARVESATRLDTFLAAKLTGRSRSQVQLLVRDGLVSVNSQLVTRTSHLLNTGDTVILTWPSQPSASEPQVQPATLSAVYEDDHILVIDKPPGIAVHRGHGHASGTLVDLLLTSWPEITDVGDPARPGIVHRLDLDTSGLLVVALTQPAFDRLSSMVRRHEIVRGYLALVHGQVTPSEGIIEAPVGRDPINRTRQAVVTAGKPSRTRYRVKSQYEKTALVDIELETGRMHQIRVHMAAIGHPVVGDRTYGPREKTPYAPPRQFLHAARLSFQHPVTHLPVEAKSDLPADLRDALSHYSSPSPSGTGRG